MKRLLLVLLILIPLVLLSVWLTKRPTQPRSVKTTMTFLGFTNAVAGAPLTNAHFAFSNIPSGYCAWQTFQVGQFDGTNWVFPKKVHGFFGSFQPSGNFNGRPTKYVFSGTVPVVSTSAPTRVVMCLTLDPSGPLEKFWAKVARMLGLQNPDPQYFMTNDFNFTATTPSPP